MNNINNEVTVEIDIDDICEDLPKKMVYLKFDPSRTDYGNLEKDLVEQLFNSYSDHLRDQSNIPQIITCRYHFQNIASDIVKQLKIKTYKTLY